MLKATPVLESRGRVVDVRRNVWCTCTCTVGVWRNVWCTCYDTGGSCVVVWRRGGARVACVWTGGGFAVPDRVAFEGALNLGPILHVVPLDLHCFRRLLDNASTIIITHRGSAGCSA